MRRKRRRFTTDNDVGRDRKRRVLELARKYFPSAWDLESYADSNWPNVVVNDGERNLSDPKRRATSLIVAFDSKTPPSPPPAVPDAPRNLQPKVVDNALSALFETQNRPLNALCSGFHSDTKNNGTAILNGIGFQAPSTAVKCLKAPDFGLLLEKLGYQAMHFLLTKACLLLPVFTEKTEGRGGSPEEVLNIYQLTGNPSLQWVETNAQSLSKRQQGGVFAMTDIIYRGRELLKKRKHRRSVFPSTHVLVGGKPSRRSALKLFHYIYSRHEPSRHANFTRKANRKRLEPLIILLQQTLRRASNKKLSYILKKHCPISEGLLVSGDDEETDVEEEDSEEEDAIRLAQVDFDPVASETRINKRNVRRRASKTQAINNSADVKQLAQSFLGAKSVGKFVYSVCSSIFPRELLGCKHNWIIFRRFITFFLSMRKFDAVETDAVLEQIQITKIPWMYSSTSRSGTCSASDLERRKELFRYLFSWICRDLVACLVSTNFYCTDRESNRMRIIFFRRPVWNRLNELGTSQLLRDNFRTIDRMERSRIRFECKLRRALTYHTRLRWIPKPNGIRPLQLPVVDGRRSPFVVARGRNFWRTLGAVLQHEIHHLEDSSVFSKRDIYRKFLRFVEEWRACGKPRMFVAKFDVARSFDTISCSKLVDCVLPRALKSIEYVVIRYKVYLRRGEKVRCMSKAVVRENAGDEASFFRLIRNQLANMHRACVLIDSVSVSVVSRRDVLNAMSHIVAKNVIKLGDSFHVQTRGIPQGLPLSTMLATLYYADLERKTQLKDFLSLEKPCLSMRFVDDFLFASSSQSTAEKLSQTMLAGFPEYGTTVNGYKSKSNFSGYGLAMLRIPWCGIVIDTLTMEVLVDYSRYHSCRIRDTFTLDVGPAWKESLRTKAVDYCFNPTISPIHVDRRINSAQTAALNYYQAALMMLIKILAFMDEVFKQRRIGPEEFSRTFEATCNASCRSLQRRLCSDNVFLSKRDFEQLATAAISKVITKVKSQKRRTLLRDYLARLETRLTLHFKRTYSAALHDRKSQDLLKLIA